MLARLFLTLVLLATSALCPGYGAGIPPSQSGMDTHFVTGRFGERPQSAPLVAGQSTDLSGTYTGGLNYPSEGLSGVATLVITGDSFKLTIKSTTLTGRIIAVTANGYVAVTMSFDGPSRKSISLIALKTGQSLSLKSISTEAGDFYFDTRVNGFQRLKPNFQATPAPVSTNVNAFSNASNRDGNTNHKAPRNANRHANMNATGADNSNNISTTNANASSNANTNAPTTATPTPQGMGSSFSSKLKGDANVVFTTPDSMKMDETRDIELLVSPSESVEKLKEALSEPGSTGSGTTKYADRMEAQLTGTGFTIMPISPAIQPVEPGTTTTWQWQIKPKDAGAQRLDLTLSAVLNDGKDKRMERTFHRDIRINVSFTQRASSFIATLKDFQWLWAVIILPLAGVIYGWWRKKRSKTDKDK